jgi:hypothetical protein
VTVYAAEVRDEEGAMGSVQARPIGMTLALLVLLALPAPAWGTRAPRRIATPSKISIGSTGLRLGGHVTASRYRSCEEDRRVVLYKEAVGGRPEPMAHTTTGEHGAWRITLSGYAGITLTPFFAKVKASRRASAGTIHVCGGARSRAIKPGS